MAKNAINLKTPASGALISLRRETYVEAARLTLVSGFLRTSRIIKKIAINDEQYKSVFRK